MPETKLNVSIEAQNNSKRAFDSLKKGTKDAGQGMDSFAKKGSKAFDNVRKGARTAAKAVRAVGKAIGNIALEAVKAAAKLALLPAAAIAGFAALNVAIAESVDKIGKLAITLNIPVEQLSKLKFAAEQGGASLEDVERSMKKLSTATPEVVKAADKLGVTLGPNLKDNLVNVSTALSGVQDNSERLRLAQILLGETGAKLIPIFGDGGVAAAKAGVELERLGGVITGDQAAAGAGLSDAFNRLKTAVAGIGNRLLEAFGPQITAAFNKFAFTLGAVAPEIGKVFKDLAALVRTTFETISTIISKGKTGEVLLAGFKAAFKNLFQFLTNANFLLGFLEIGVGFGIQIVTGINKAIAKGIGQVISGLFDLLADGIEKLPFGIGDSFAAGVRSSGNSIAAAGELLAEQFTKPLDDIADSLQEDGFERIEDAASQTLSNFKKFVADFKSEIDDPEILALLDALGDRASNLGASVSNLGTAIGQASSRVAAGAVTQANAGATATIDGGGGGGLFGNVFQSINRGIKTLVDTARKQLKMTDESVKAGPDDSEKKKVARRFGFRTQVSFGNELDRFNSLLDSMLSNIGPVTKSLVDLAQTLKVAEQKGVPRSTTGSILNQTAGRISQLSSGIEDVFIKPLFEKVRSGAIPSSTGDSAAQALIATFQTALGDVAHNSFDDPRSAELFNSMAASVLNNLGEAIDKESRKPKTLFAGFIDGFEAVSDAAGDAGAVGEQLVSDLTSGIKGGFDFVFNSIIDGTFKIEDAFTSLLDGIARNVLDTVSDLAAKQVSSAIGTGITSLFASANGNVFNGGGPIKAFASGGVLSGPVTFPLSGGRTGLAGEAGPEAIMPLARDKRGKLGVRSEGGGGQTVVNFNINALDTQTGTEFLIKNKKIIESVVMNAAATKPGFKRAIGA